MREGVFGAIFMREEVFMSFKGAGDVENVNLLLYESRQFAIVKNGHL